MLLDGNTADENGDIDWGAPDKGVHAFINELERGLGTYLYGVFSRSGPSVLASTMMGTWPFRAAQFRYRSWSRWRRGHYCGALRTVVARSGLPESIDRCLRPTAQDEVAVTGDLRSRVQPTVRALAQLRTRGWGVSFVVGDAAPAEGRPGQVRDCVRRLAE
jgi:hypothetical protein